MVSQKDWERHCKCLQHQVDDYKCGKEKIDFFDSSKTIQDCKYQQRVADLRSRYYPIRISQSLAICAFIVSLLSFFRPISLFIEDNPKIIITALIFVLVIITSILKIRHVRLQNIIEAAEIKIQYDDINKSNGEPGYFGMYV